MRRMYCRSLAIPALAAVALLAVPAAGAHAQDAEPDRIVSSEIAVSREAAELRFELSDGRTVDLRLAADRSVRVGTTRIGTYQRRDALDQSWRELLQRAMDAPTAELAGVLATWEPPTAAGETGQRLSRELATALSAAARATAQTVPAADAADSIRRLTERIRELERAAQAPATVDPDQRRQGLRVEARAETARQRARSPLRHVTRGLAGVFSTLVAYAVLVGLGILAVFFGRRHLEGIADTARRATVRSGLVGLAATFLVLPAYILGILALAISIVGIPFLLVYLPLFPVAVALAALGGYLAVAHGAGEALAERRFAGDEFFTRANSYYYVLTGLGLLIVLFLVAHVVSMAGPWLAFLKGLLTFMAVTLTWAAFTVGFGAFLISRGGTRPTPEPGRLPEEEGIHV